MKEGRVIEEHKTNYIISTEDGELVATVRGSFFDTEEFPKVGDWVLCSEVSNNKAVIEEILPRTSTIVRKSANTEIPQIILANVDLIFIVMGMDGDFNLSRLERYLLLASQSNVRAVVILNKADQVENVDIYINETKAVTGETPVHAVSALTSEGMEILLTYFNPDTTIVLLGSSGAGKSTITNWLLREDKQSVADVRVDDSRGRHTTTSRQLFSLPTGGFLIDTPGMRELGISESSADAEDDVFAKIEALSNECQFNNCDHEKSKGCAVLEAIALGEVTERQLKNYQKLKRERLHEESKYNEELAVKANLQQKKLIQKRVGVLRKKNFGREEE